MKNQLNFTQGFTGIWFIYFIRYIILFSYIIPIRSATMYVLYYCKCTYICVYCIIHTDVCVLCMALQCVLLKSACEPGHGEDGVLVDDPARQSHPWHCGPYQHYPWGAGQSRISAHRQDWHSHTEWDGGQYINVYNIYIYEAERYTDTREF